MLKRAPMLLSILLLAACSASDGGNGNAPAPAPAQTTAAAASTAAPAASTTAPASAATAPAPATTVPTPASDPAPATTSTPAAAASPAFVDTGKWIEGKHYFRIEPSQPKVTGTDKIEMVEAFSYGCPVCYQAHAFVDRIAAALPPDAVMVYLPVSFRPDENWPVYQRAFYAAQALGIAEKAHDALFDATWKTGETATYDLATGAPKPKSEWPSIDVLAKFYSQYGVKPDEFVAVADSFSVNTKMKRADELTKAYAVDGTPTLIVDGKYRFNNISAGGFPQMVELAKYLVAREAAGK